MSAAAIDELGKSVRVLRLKHGHEILCFSALRALPEGFILLHKVQTRTNVSKYLNLQSSATNSKPTAVLHACIVLIPAIHLVLLDAFLRLWLVHLLTVDVLLLEAEETSETM
jgi:hypothetical protein